MKKICFLGLFLILTSTFYSQIFNRVYPSFRNEKRTVDGVFTRSISLPNHEAIFISVAWSLDTNYAYTFATKVDSMGDIIWYKPIADSLESITPADFIKYGENKFIVCGAKYTADRKKRFYWYGIYNTEMELLEEHVYPTSFDHPIFWRAIQTKQGFFVFCGGNGLLDNRGNGASDRAKASITCIDSTGKLKWHHEFWDSTQIHDLHIFYDLVEDEYGNIYTCGVRQKTDLNPDGIMLKVDPNGNILWYIQEPSPNYAEGFDYISPQTNGNLIVVGQSLNPDIFNSDPWSEIYLNVIDSSGKSLKTKRFFRKYDFDLRDCVATTDGNIVCGGSIRDSANQWLNGWIFKMTTNGDMIWSRVLDHVDWNLEQMFHLNAALDGGFYLGGFSWLPGINESRAWLVKTDSLGCDDTNCIMTSTSNGNNYKNKLFELYPNPAQDYIIIYLNDNELSQRKYFLRYFNQNGQMILSKSFSGIKNEIDINAIPTGMYFYQINDGKKLIQAGKIVKM